MDENRFFENILSLPELEVLSAEHFSNKIIIKCKINTKKSLCPNCRNETSIINQYTLHKAQDLSIAGKEVWLHIDVPQFVCKNCNRFFTHRIDWLESSKGCTKRQTMWIFELSSKQAFTEVAAIVNVCHKTVERIYLKIAEQVVNVKKRIKNVRWLGIDEIAHRKGKGDYVCVLTDLQRGTHVDILEFRTKEYLLAYFKALGDVFCKQIEYVACDFWTSYISLSKELFSNAQIVVDHFHIVKLLNEPLDYYRKKLRRKHNDIQEFKQIKWILFKRLENCTEIEKSKLEAAFSRSPKLKQIYNLRNSFHNVITLDCNENKALEKLDNWLTKATNMKRTPFKRFIKTITKRKKEVLAFIQTGISNAVTEGLNNIIRYMKRISFGLPNFEHMRLRVLAYSC